MKLNFYGADQCVTGSCHCLEVNGKNILIDCGLQQGRDEVNNEALPFHPGSIDFVLITHAHIDHTGRVPMLVKQGFRGRILTTRVTANLMDIMLLDSAHIQESDAEWKNRKAARSGALPLDKIDVLFFCTAHGDTKKFMESHNLPEELKIIDLSMDYRIASPEHDFIYGLPELNRRATCKAKHVANPGCFATCIQLGLLPLAKHLMLNNDIMVNAITGSTGAGVKPGSTSHFSWRNNNMSVYKAFEHQHVPEIKQSLKQLQNSFDADIDFIPYRGDFARGIFATIVVRTKVALDEIVRMYEEYYAKDSFVHIVEKNIDLKQVVNTNKCLLHLEKHGDKLLIISCIDNLLKGASGQAVHNMNLMFNLEETVGLRLKPSAF